MVFVGLQCFTDCHLPKRMCRETSQIAVDLDFKMKLTPSQKNPLVKKSYPFCLLSCKKMRISQEFVKNDDQNMPPTSGGNLRPKKKSPQKRKLKY